MSSYRDPVVTVNRKLGIANLVQGYRRQGHAPPSKKVGEPLLEIGRGNVAKARAAPEEPGQQLQIVEEGHHDV